MQRSTKLGDAHFHLEELQRHRHQKTLLGELYSGPKWFATSAKGPSEPAVLAVPCRYCLLYVARLAVVAASAPFQHSPVPTVIRSAGVCARNPSFIHRAITSVYKAGDQNSLAVASQSLAGF